MRGLGSTGFPRLRHRAYHAGAWPQSPRVSACVLGWPLHIDHLARGFVPPANLSKRPSPVPSVASTSRRLVPGLCPQTRRTGRRAGRRGPARLGAPGGRGRSLPPEQTGEGAARPLTRRAPTPPHGGHDTPSTRTLSPLPLAPLLPSRPLPPLPLPPVPPSRPLPGGSVTHPAAPCPLPSARMRAHTHERPPPQTSVREKKKREVEECTPARARAGATPASRGEADDVRSGPPQRVPPMWRARGRLRRAPLRWLPVVPSIGEGPQSPPPVQSDSG